MAIKCGHCREAHATVAQVRACSETPNVPKSLKRTLDDVAREYPGSISFTEQDERDMQRMEMEGDRADSLRDEAAKAAWKSSVETFDGALVNEVNELLATKVIPADHQRWAKAVRAMLAGESGVITAYALRTAIARLDAFPNVRAGSTPATEEGLYRLDGRLYQVLRAKESQRLYAKLVTFPPDGVKRRPTLTYARGIVFQLTASHLVPVEEAQEITRKTGWCIFGHFLTNPQSIARGMGPVCYARYPHLAKNAVAS